MMVRSAHPAGLQITFARRRDRIMTAKPQIPTPSRSF
jgi:hypothetical protein